ncbi:hypothetical protein [Saccharopolyspora shandongensis]|uniref:hypothetical protein n=1 Tax=Saccharopolyspora shandongensis TaxID=418495 RepID=UPI0033DDF178
MTEQEATEAVGTNEPQRDKERGFLRRNGWVLAIAALLTLITVVTGTTWAGQHAALGDQKSRISELEDQLKTAELKKSELVEKDLLTSLGVSRNRLNKDARIITDLVKTALTWDSGTAYEQARTRLKDKHALSEDKGFLQQFMPASRYNEDAGGKRYYYIDVQGLNSAVGGDPDIEVAKVAAGDYTYAVLVDAAVTSDSVEQNNANPGRVTADRRMLLFVTVDADGGVSDLSGVPASGSTRHSR